MCDNDKINYMLGMKDCEDGVNHKEGKSASYNEGYRDQYEYEQITTERCQNANRNN